ncbi:MAG: helix-turn-helix domain-containing protein [Erythrobacter sp.]
MTAMIQNVDFLVRMIAVGAAIMLLAMIVANHVRAPIKIPLIGMIVGVAGYLMNATPLMMATTPVDPIIDLVAISTPFWIWLFARRLFEREPPVRMLYIAFGLLATGWFVGNFIPSTWPAGFLLLHFTALALIGDLIRVGVFERDDDLVEQRRVIRLWLPLLVGAQAASILMFELFELATGLEGQLPLISVINSCIILLLILFSGLALLRTDPILLAEIQPEEDAEELDLSPVETVLHEKLTAVMDDGVYKEPGLTIAALADTLDTPEHRLRSLINGRLGYRNFSAFLNRHRIAEAREKLSTREDVDLPVLTIAMDLGYNSLPTFNRAFRSETGTTPSEFRRLAITQSGNDVAQLAEQETGQN